MKEKRPGSHVRLSRVTSSAFLAGPNAALKGPHWAATTSTMLLHLSPATAPRPAPPSQSHPNAWQRALAARVSLHTAERGATERDVEPGSHFPVFCPVSCFGASVVPKTRGSLQNHLFLATVSYFSLRETANKHSQKNHFCGDRAPFLSRPAPGTSWRPSEETVAGALGQCRVLRELAGGRLCTCASMWAPSAAPAAPGNGDPAWGAPRPSALPPLPCWLRSNLVSRFYQRLVDRRSFLILKI